MDFRFSTLMQLLFSFGRGTRVEKTLMQTLASQLSSTLMQLLFSFDQRTRVEKTLMQTLNSHQLSCNFCSRLARTRELIKLSCKLSLVNSHQLSCIHPRLTKSQDELTGQFIKPQTNLRALSGLVGEPNCQEPV